MSRGLGKLQRQILAYADAKVEKTDPSLYMTALPYIRSNEVADRFNTSTQNSCLAISRLVNKGLLRVFPSGREKGRSYGSLKLPEISEFELKASIRSLRVT